MNVVHKVNMVHTIAESGPKSRRVARRQAILDEARDLVNASGFDALTLQRLATRLGYAVGALYRYFPSKEALIAGLEVEVLTELAERMARVAEAARIDAPDAPIAAIIARGRIYAALPKASPEDYRLISLAVADPRVLVPGPQAADILEAARPIFGGLAEDLETAHNAGTLDSGAPVDRALILWSGLQGVLQTQKLARVAPELIVPERLAAEFIVSLLYSWGASRDMLQSNQIFLDQLPETAWI